MIKVETVGNISNLAIDIKREIVKHQYKELNEITQKGEQLIKKRINSQSFGFTPLDQTYLQNKVSLGHSSKMFVATGTYLKSILSTVLSHKQGFIFIDPQAKSKYGTSYTLIATVLEYGSTKVNIPARPLWRSSMELIKKDVRRNYFGLHKLKNRLENMY